MTSDNMNPDVQQCPSCLATLVRQVSVVGGQVWLLCGRCSLRWTIRERRYESASPYRGFERRRPTIGWQSCVLVVENQIEWLRREIAALIRHSDALNERVRQVQEHADALSRKLRILMEARTQRRNVGGGSHSAAVCVHVEEDWSTPGGGG
jgi:hypothetical protein